MAFKFEKLIVWQKALDLSSDIHTVTKPSPKMKWLSFHHK